MVVVSSGFHKTHVTTAAGAAADRGLLSLAITAAYPTPRLRRALGRLGLADKGRVARLIERGENIPEQRLRAIFAPELLDEIARALTAIPPLRRYRYSLSAPAWRLHGRRAAGVLQAAANARIYHYRAGFGGVSVGRARELGMVTLCDHSIAHPQVLERLIENGGDIAAAAAAAMRRDELNGISRAILDDINQADAILVNSRFVKDTFLALGWDPERIHVVYLGVDDNFLRGGSIARRSPASGPLRMLFAGRLEPRKGVDTMVDALQRLDAEVDWELAVAGPVDPAVEADHGRFLEDPRVKLLGTLRRPELLEQMLAAPVFIFPSYAEGSARAVFEALAAGCYVITTPNSGSIVEDGVHGSLVASGNAGALAEAIIAADRDRAAIAEIGTRNAELIAACHRQSDYGDALAALYRRLA
jgi:glycosyltransferase involved in cell wall biosynthesis